MNSKEEKKYWTQRYTNHETGWDIGYVSTPLKTYIDQLTDKKIRILIPGAGNAYEATYLHEQGFTNVFVLDISEIPLHEFQHRNPNFNAQHLICDDFFKHTGAYDLIIEQTFFCSFFPLPETRNQYAKHMQSLVVNGGKLVGLWFDIPLQPNQTKRPFGGDITEYKQLLTPYFEVKTLQPCYNSIPERQGNELFGIFVRKN